jgi:hypothetical protein
MNSEAAKTGLAQMVTITLPILEACQTAERSISDEAYVSGGGVAMLAATRAMYNAQGRDWRAWQGPMERSLIAAQHPSGYWRATRADRDGLAMADLIESTCLFSLQLQVYQHYIPTFDIRKMDPHKTATVLDGSDSGLIIQ